MTDIVERLRAPAYWISGSSEGHEGDNSAPLEAADYITTFRAEADRWHSMYCEVYALWDGQRAEVGMLHGRIERLRKALERIAYGKYHWEADAQEEARAALAQEKPHD
jgi:hypothetical protein